MDTNTLKINDESKTITAISYVSNSLSITAGEDYEVPPAINGSSNVWTITLKADRKKSEGPANTFNSRSGGAGKEYTNTSGDDTPEELNFCFQVNVTFATSLGSTTVVINLGQGSYGGLIPTNNWWIGGANVFSEDTPRIEFKAGNQITTLGISGDHDDFKLEWKDARPASPIQRVFVLMLENHSFDNMLALSGIPGINAATTSNYNSHNGQNYYVSGNAPGNMPTDPGHEFTDVVEQLCGKEASYVAHHPYPPINNSGFAANYATTTTEGNPPLHADIGEIMQCFNSSSQIPVLYQLASEYVVCDQWFSSLPGPTWPNRFFLHGASSNGLDHSPTDTEMTEWETVDGFKYPHGSIFDRMNSSAITWRLYHDMCGPIEGSLSQVSSIHGIQLWDVHELETFEKDVQSLSYPYQYTFIEPNYGDTTDGSYEGGSSQHPMDGVNGGEGLISKVYEAIRNSPIWMESMLIITYDEHGGFYDHVAPGPCVPPGDGGEQSKYNDYGFDFARYGVRVPAVIVSPWTQKGIVDSTIYDHSSVLATLEFLFGLQPLTERDGNANTFEHLITTTARTDTPERLQRPAVPVVRRPQLRYAERAAREMEPVPDRSSLRAFLGTALKADTQLATTAEERAAAVGRYKSVKTRGEARYYLRDVAAKVRAERARRLT